jgi:sialate O-acetylesterase
MGITYPTMKLPRFVICLICTFQTCLAARSATETQFLAGIFIDNMVLQRGMADPIWGWTTPGATVTVSVEGSRTSVKATAGTDGKWLVKLPAPPVGGPYSIKISGPQTVTLKNVLVGEVWLCAGQSNMGLSVSEADNAAAEIADAKRPTIRLISPKGKYDMAPSTRLDGQWVECSPETVAKFSAVGYFFGRQLSQDLKVPIGLINMGWGGTNIETWTSREAVLQVQPALEPELQTLVKVANGEDIYAAWYAANDPGAANNNGWAAPTFDDSAWEARRLPNVPEWGCFGDLWNVFEGTIWFRSTFEVAAPVGDMTVNFNGSGIDTVWVNGQKIGATLDGSARSYGIPAKSLQPGKNTLAIRFIHPNKNSMVGVTCPADKFTLVAADGSSKSLAGDWKFHLGCALKDASPLPPTLHQNIPTVVYNGMIAPLAPFAIRGSVWYQGETNTGDHAAGYRKLLVSMIGCWRKQWAQGDFPFYIVQLPFYGPAQTNPDDRDLWRNWSAEMRESQAWAAKHAPNSGLAVTLELGNAENVHTTHKLDVGRRLALIALAKTYAKKVVYAGPEYQSMTVAANSIRLNFSLAGSPLAARDKAPLAGFAITGEDRKWVWGDAKIDGDAIVVSSPQVPKPVAVRYAWSANPVGNLVNQAGLPASPFRTDDWPLVSKDY